VDLLDPLAPLAPARKLTRTCGIVQGTSVRTWQDDGERNCQHDDVEDFWEPLRGRWPAGAAVLHWHILPGEDPAVAAAAEAYRGLTAHPGLDAVPARWLHQTLYLVGKAGAPEVAQMAGQVRATARLWAPMRVSYGPAVLAAQSVVLTASPAEPAAQLHGAVVAAAAAVLGDRAAAPAQVPYWGHLTIAYANRRIDDGPLLDWLGAHRCEPVTITVRAIHLVRQVYHNHLFTWEPVAAVALKA
jgi:2'-5' RNA ligase